MDMTGNQGRQGAPPQGSNDLGLVLVHQRVALQQWILRGREPQQCFLQPMPWSEIVCAGISAAWEGSQHLPGGCSGQQASEPPLGQWPS